MGDQADGPSSAAQSAREDSEGQIGLWGRLREAFGRTPENAPETPVNGQAILPEPEAGLRPGLLNLRRMRVDDVAIPKVEIVSVEVDITEADLVRVFRESGFTRLPVFSGTLDTPLGLVHLKDFALTHGFNATTAKFELRKMIRPLIYAPPSMPIGVLLQKMQTERMHMALVIDEYGGVDGLVTIEDLIEQVVGEIEDEHDTAESRPWTLETPGCYLAQARAPLDEFEAEIGMRLKEPEEDEEIDTLGGLVFVLSGRVPARGEVIKHPNGPEFEIVDADPRRIKRLRVRLPAVGAD